MIEFIKEFGITFLCFFIGYSVVECVNDFLMIESKYLSNGDIPYDEEEVE